MNFAFIHIGRETALPRICVASIRRFNPHSKIFQLSDEHSPPVHPEVNVIRYSELDANNIMLFRLQAYSNLPADGPTLFIDSDMILTRKISEAEFPTKDYVLLNRNFGRDDRIVNVEYRGAIYDEHKGKTWGEVYPILACVIFARDKKIFIDLQDRLRSMPEKYHFWMGDQEALRDYAAANMSEIALVEERDYACLPEQYDPTAGAAIVHFKGRSRKLAMINSGLKSKLVTRDELEQCKVSRITS